MHLDIEFRPKTDPRTYAYLYDIQWFSCHASLGRKRTPGRLGLQMKQEVNPDRLGYKRGGSDTGGDVVVVTVGVAAGDHFADETGQEE